MRKQWRYRKRSQEPPQNAVPYTPPHAGAIAAYIALKEDTKDHSHHDRDAELQLQIDGSRVCLAQSPQAAGSSRQRTSSGRRSTHQATRQTRPPRWPAPSGTANPPSSYSIRRECLGQVRRAFQDKPGNRQAKETRRAHHRRQPSNGIPRQTTVATRPGIPATSGKQPPVPKSVLLRRWLRAVRTRHRI